MNSYENVTWNEEEIEEWLHEEWLRVEAMGGEGFTLSEVWEEQEAKKRRTEEGEEEEEEMEEDPYEKEERQRGRSKRSIFQGN